jgi:hypothetical protein
VLLVGAFFLVVGLALLACSSFGSGDDAPTTTPESGASVDGGAGDAPLGDGGSDSDAPFCTGPYVYCDDYDDPGRSVGTVSVDDGGTLALTDAAAVTSPSALRARVLPPPPGPECYSATRTTSLDSAVPNGFRAELQMLPGGLGGVLPTQPTALGVGVTASDSVGQRCDYYLQISADTATLTFEPRDGAGAVTTADLSRRPQGGGWHPLVLEIKGAAGARVASVTIDGQPAITDTPVPSYCQGATRLTETSVGIFCVGQGASAPVEAWFDNVKLTAN